MKPITVDKKWLLEKMMENRSNHREVFEAALDGYITHGTLLLEQKKQALLAGKNPEIHISLDRPTDHTRDYDRVIGMVTAHQGDTFELAEQDYAQYVDDDWSWKRQWARTSNSYAAGKFSEVYGVDAIEEDPF
jgi:hypothetical protein